MPTKSVKPKRPESIISSNYIKQHIDMIHKKLSRSQNKNLKEREVRSLLESIYNRKTKFSKGVKEMRNDHDKFVEAVIKDHLFGKHRHKKYWKNLKEYRKNEIKHNDCRSNSFENSDWGMINHDTIGRNDDSSDQTVKSKRTVKTMGGGCEVSGNLSDWLSEIKIRNGRNLKSKKNGKKVKIDLSDVNKKLKFEVKEEGEKKKEEESKKNLQLEFHKKILKLIEESKEQNINVSINKNDLTFSKVNTVENSESKYKWFWWKGKQHKWKEEWNSSKIRSSEQREIVRKQLTSPLDPFSKDVYEDLIPQKLKNKIKTIDINLDENKWAKEFAWMRSSNINQFKIFTMMEDEINRHLEYLSKNPDEPKFTSKEELYLKDLVVFISTKIESCFSSIIARSPHIQYSDQHLEIFNKNWKLNIKYIHINFIWVMRLLLKRSREASRLDFAYGLISQNHCTIKNDWIILNELFVKQLFADFTTKLLTKLRIAEILVLFFMFYPSAYDATLILSQYEEWREISKPQKSISESHEDSNLTIDPKF